MGERPSAAAARGARGEDGAQWQEPRTRGAPSTVVAFLRLLDHLLLLRCGHLLLRGEPPAGLRLGVAQPRADDGEEAAGVREGPRAAVRAPEGLAPLGAEAVHELPVEEDEGGHHLTFDLLDLGMCRPDLRLELLAVQYAEALVAVGTGLQGRPLQAGRRRARVDPARVARRVGARSCVCEVAGHELARALHGRRVDGQGLRERALQGAEGGEREGAVELHPARGVVPVVRYPRQDHHLDLVAGQARIQEWAQRLGHEVLAVRARGPVVHLDGDRRADRGRRRLRRQQAGRRALRRPLRKRVAQGRRAILHRRREGMELLGPSIHVQVEDRGDYGGQREGHACGCDVLYGPALLLGVRTRQEWPLLVVRRVGRDMLRFFQLPVFRLTRHRQLPSGATLPRVWGPLLAHAGAAPVPLCPRARLPGLR
mmetsp:Transcript_17466/g.49575  ORF Transcript_17466/g.49575 Transcript_17466/m.49575 type:complete len:426 (-) Transcript_17466:129-1406(-)